MKQEFEFEIALSFAGEDREYVDQVANLLRRDGIKIFYDRFEEANLWGKNLYDYLSDIYKNKALYTVMFISHNYADKLWTNHERQSMQARAFQENSEYILPARFDSTEIPGVLSTIGFINIDNKPPEQFVDIIKRKLVNSGRTIPSEQVRRSIFSTELMKRVDPIIAQFLVINSEEKPIIGVQVNAIADNNTYLEGKTNESGITEIKITTRRKYKILIAHKEYGGQIIEDWDPIDNIKIKLQFTENTGSIFCYSSCYVPNFSGRLNIIYDTSYRTYLYAENISFKGQTQQPYSFKLNEPFELEDANGTVLVCTVIYISGRISLMQYHYKTIIA